MLKALYYCHKICKIIHRDIKPENIAINHNGEAVLIDFGVSVDTFDRKDDKLDENLGTTILYAPEMFMDDQKIHGERTDIWALGITFFYLVCGQYPWREAKKLYELKEHVLLKDIDFSLIKDEGVRSLLKQILMKDP